jgi:hypothetical protein
MRKTLVILSFAAGLGAAGLGLVYSQSAGAVPADATSVKEAATAASSLQRAEYTERRTRHGVVKCFRALVIGPYRCHYYRDPL